MCDEEAQNSPVVLTPEMIEAGAKIISTYFYDAVAHGSQSARETAIEVYRAMYNQRETLSQTANSPRTPPISLGDLDTI